MTAIKLAQISVLFGFFPLIMAILAHIIAAFSGVNISEGSVIPCYIFGVNIGGVLQGMAVMVFALIGTIPMMLLGLMISGIWYSNGG